MIKYLDFITKANSSVKAMIKDLLWYPWEVLSLFTIQ